MKSKSLNSLICHSNVTTDNLQTLPTSNDDRIPSSSSFVHERETVDLNDILSRNQPRIVARLPAAVVDAIEENVRKRRKLNPYERYRLG
jgi:hypothetical protein